MEGWAKKEKLLAPQASADTIKKGSMYNIRIGIIPTFHYSIVPSGA